MSWTQGFLRAEVENTFLAHWGCRTLYCKVPNKEKERSIFLVHRAPLCGHPLPGTQDPWLTLKWPGGQAGAGMSQVRVSYNARELAPRLRDNE